MLHGDRGRSPPQARSRAAPGAGPRPTRRWRAGPCRTRAPDAQSASRPRCPGTLKDAAGGSVSPVAGRGPGDQGDARRARPGPAAAGRLRQARLTGGDSCLRAPLNAAGPQPVAASTHASARSRAQRDPKRSGEVLRPSRPPPLDPRGTGATVPKSGIIASQAALGASVPRRETRGARREGAAASTSRAADPRQARAQAAESHVE